MLPKTAGQWLRILVLSPDCQGTPCLVGGRLMVLVMRLACARRGRWLLLRGLAPCSRGHVAVLSTYESTARRTIWWRAGELCYRGDCYPCGSLRGSQ